MTEGKRRGSAHMTMGKGTFRWACYAYSPRKHRHLRVKRAAPYSESIIPLLGSYISMVLTVSHLRNSDRRSL